MMPGRLLHRLASVLLPKEACERVVESQLADFQHEWSRSSSASQRALILIRGYLAFCVVFVSCAAGMSAIAPDEQRALRRVLKIAVAVTLLTTVGLAMAFLGNLPPPAHADAARLAEWQRFRWVLFLNNASLLVPLSVSVGLVCGIAMGLQHHTSRASRRVVLIVAAAACVAIFVMSSWILPLGFRAVSQAIRGQPSSGLPAASTLGDDRLALVAVERTPTAGPGTIRGAEVGYHLRWSWPFAAFALALFELSLIHRGRITRVVLGTTGCAAYFYWVRDVTDKLVWDSGLPPIVVAWWPNVMFVVLSIVIITISRPRAVRIA